MEIKNNRLVGVPFRATPNVGGLIKPIYIVMHFDAASNSTSAVNWMSDPKSKVSAHIHISRDGVVTQLVPFNVKAWHAGKSTWKGLNNLNDHSIGIELQNTGSQEYTTQQINAAIEVCKAIKSSYQIREIVGHNDIAPGRKSDPGKQFPWSKFKAL
ncbi:N-acetylmuramoyl-L-alanine amidase [Sphingobacterium sp. 1.A.4]|uniref:N-acetylmuramoyl-L-alanine amidase n=1 Tax=Sphingobacterium sp. 1.A.4 TaxID=2044603 RepID=UPI0015D51725|nr:N-acetylmuramoyl-L-alanine amidase [Sphingobacterium sp. 1.A.4]